MAQQMDNATAETRTNQKGTAGGPRTTTGKLRSRSNALKSGIFSRIVFQGDSLKETRKSFNCTLRDIRTSIGPRDTLEDFLTEALVLELLRLARVYQVDAKVGPSLFDRASESQGGNGDAALARAIGEETSSVHKLPPAELLIRYHRSVWHHIDRILDRLERPRHKTRSSAVPRDTSTTNRVTRS